MIRLSALLLSSLFLSASQKAFAEMIRGSGKHDTLDYRELQTNDGRAFQYAVTLNTEATGAQLASCFDTDKEEMGAIILAAMRTGFMDYELDFDNINFLKLQSSRRAEEGHRKLGSYKYEGTGNCRKCDPDNGDRRELAERQLAIEDKIKARMARALRIALKETFLEVHTQSCFAGLNLSLETDLVFYDSVV